MTADDAGIAPFDRAQVRRQRERAARGFARHDFLASEVADRVLDRLADTTRHYDLALDLGCHDGVIARRLASQPEGERRIGTLVQADGAPAMARAARHNGMPTLCADEELLAIADGSLDLVVSALALHAVNDLPGALVQVQRALKPDGLLLAAMLGGRSLAELRAVLIEAESEVRGGAAPRVAPFVDVRDAGGLLQRARFALPVVDSDIIHVTYENALALMRDLRGMGLANALTERPRTLTPRSVLVRAAALYDARHACANGVTVTFEIVYLHGWKPAPSQQRPLRPGSARNRLADALGTEEIAAGDKARSR